MDASWEPQTKLDSSRTKLTDAAESLVGAVHQLTTESKDQRTDSEEVKKLKAEMRVLTAEVTDVRQRCQGLQEEVVDMATRLKKLKNLLDTERQVSTSAGEQHPSD